MFEIINYGIADRGKKGILDSHICFVLGKSDYIFIPINIVELKTCNILTSPPIFRRKKQNQVVPFPDG